ncbi:MAG: phosphomannomutase/phosphoglucomutase [Candidatus Riflebacteria bacterium]|nr:phosphomannomutase/phosphoglucomutase [Candidatus Riflebacteria bacterium]
MSIFKAYDIRGIVPDQIDEVLARRIGQAFVTLRKARSVTVGRDMRVSSPGLARAVVEGARDAGAEVTDIGLVSTPMLNFATAFYGTEGGIQVTASHNPGAYNGFKMCGPGATPVSFDTGIGDIEKWVAGPALRFEPAARRGSLSEREVFEDYHQFLAKLVKLGNRPLRLVADSANGVTGVREFRILQRYYPEIEGMFLEPDGNFPNHEPNPLLPENIRPLQDQVLARRADLGIAFDGDGDRVAFVDNLGQAVSGDLVTALIGRAELRRHPGATVLYDLRSSRAVKEDIERLGGVAKKCRVGHSFIKQMMRQENAVLAGELSGHFYFKDKFFLDSGILAALKVLEILSTTDQTMAELVKPLARYHRSGEINFHVKDQDAVLARVEEVFSGKGELSKLDGLSVDCPDWWFNLRKSNTEPLLRINLEANSEDLMKRKLEEVKALLAGD